jgi:phosphoenolpyruvate carboxylase
VVPLFETVKDLRGAGLVIRKLLSIDWYSEHIIKNHSGHQEVFILKAIFKLILVDP